MTANNGSDSIKNKTVGLIYLSTVAKAPFSEDFKVLFFLRPDGIGIIGNPNISFGRSTLYGSLSQTRYLSAYNTWTNDGAY